MPAPGASAPAVRGRRAVRAHVRAKDVVVGRVERVPFGRAGQGGVHAPRASAAGTRE